MPDSPLPPSWGPAPFDEWDLDAVLSGATADIPDDLRPVAETLAALRAAPAAAELRGELAAMTEFRALGLGQTGRRARQGDTLEFSVLLAGGSPRRAARRHAHRRPGAPVSRRAGMLMGAAAVVLIVIVVAFSGNLPAPIERLARFVHPAATSSAGHHTGRGHTSPERHGGGTATHVTPSAASGATPSSRPVTPEPSPAERGRFCQDMYRSLFQRPRSRSSRTAGIDRWQRLSEQDGDPAQVFRSCSPYWKPPFPDGFPHGFPGAGSPGSARVSVNTGQGNQGPGGAFAQPGQQHYAGSRSANTGPVPQNQGSGPAPNP